MSPTVRKIAAVVNPRAGRGRGPAVWGTVASNLEARGFKTRAWYTGGRGEGCALVHQALAAGYTDIAAVGGDGTIHEVINGLRSGDGVHAGVRLAIVPAGTGDDLIRNLGLRRGIDSAVTRILAGVERKVDLGVVVGRGSLFINFAETGLGASVIAREQRYSDRWPGRLTFLMAAIEAGVLESAVSALVLVDGKKVHHGPLISVVAANGRYFGAGMKIAPDARMDDRLLDVVILGAFTKTELLSRIWMLYRGTHVTLDKVVVHKGRSVEVRPDGAALLDLDGELYDGGPSLLTILPGALSILVD